MDALFSKKMHGLDRAVRAALAAGPVALALSGVVSNALSLVSGTFAVVLAVTSAAGSCPLYSLLQRRPS